MKKLKKRLEERISHWAVWDDLSDYQKNELIEFIKQERQRTLEEIEKHDFVLCFTRPNLCEKWKCKCKCHQTLKKEEK